jgi:acyl-CoA thioesterase I
MLRTTIATALIFYCAFAFAEDAPDLTEPFWASKTMLNEGLFFIRENAGELPSARLLFAPDKILSVKSATLQTEFVEGKDFVFDKGTNSLTLPAGSKIPFKNRADMYPPKGAPQSIGSAKDGKSNLFFSEGHVFHDLQTVVSYTHKGGEWTGVTPAFAGDKLPNTIAKLKKKERLSLVVFGDSISNGYNASKHVKAPPFQPIYGELVAEKLKQFYGAEIAFTNPSVAGWSTGNGNQNIAKVIDVKPDLVLLAFGMNDASGRLAPDKYAAAIQKMMDAVKQAQPTAEFILVATMTGNPEWSAASPELYPKYRDELAKLCKDGVVLADVTSVWTEMLKKKKFADLTGNGVNHPNDFGHRIYAQVVSSLLVP